MVIQMELPVQEWQDCALKKWAQLAPSEREKFSPVAGLEETFEACWSQLQQEDMELLERLCNNLSVSKEQHAVLFYREKGNKRFAGRQYMAAGALYSKAISHARPGTEEMAICFANRSAVLFHLGLYTVCLEDIERAQKHGYPERLRNKIIQRQEECLQRLREDSTSTPNAQYVGMIQPCRESSTDMSCDKLQELNLDKNPQLTNASSSLSLQFNTCKGRHLVASQDIAQGEVLIWEEAYVSVIIPQRNYWREKGKWDTTVSNCDLYCHHCLDRVVASLPCQHCSYAKYCSQKCMDMAWKSCHYAECSVGALLLALGIFCHTSLRTVLVTGCRLASELLHLTLSEDSMVGDQGLSVRRNTDEKYCSSYQAVVNLLPHTDRHKAEFKFLCGFTTAALCKKLCLEDVGSSIERTRSETTETNAIQDQCSDLLSLGPAILRHMLQLYCNAQAVTVLQEEYEECNSSLVERNKSTRLATAVFPVLSLLNHSCDPNTSVSFRGRCAMVRASRPIKRGEEVAHCYGPHRLRFDVKERQKLLKDQYFFVCQCEACTKEQRTDHSSYDFSCPKCKSLLQWASPLTKDHPASRLAKTTALPWVNAVGLKDPVDKKLDSILSANLVATGVPLRPMFASAWVNRSVAMWGEQLMEAVHAEYSKKDLLVFLTTIKEADDYVSEALFEEGEGELCCPNTSCIYTTKRDHNIHRLEQLEHSVHLAKRQLQNNQTDMAIRRLLSCLSEAEGFLSHNHMLLGEIADQLAQAEASKGDWTAAAGHLKKSIRLVELHYGSYSLELGQELYKLAQILFNGYQVSDAMTIILRAQKVLSIHYGSDHSLVQELQEMKICLLQLPGIQGLPGR
ncbi:SET and MYND domain-containing protein 4 [Rhinophrynus dorsalis]